MELKQTRLYLIRHGQVVGHERPAYNGHSDVELTELGRAQADWAARQLDDVRLDAVYASDLKRASYGGRLLAERKGLDLRLEPAFREINFGVWEGLSFDEIEKRYPGELERRFKDIVDHVIPGGETIRGFWERIERALGRLMDENAGRSLALVAHSGVNRAVLLQALGCGPDMIWRIDQDYGCLNIVDYFEDGRKMVRMSNHPNRADGSVPNRGIG